MRKIRNHHLIRLLSLVLSLHVFNISLEAVSEDAFRVSKHHERVHINIIESVAELLAEVVFQWDDIIPETDDPIHEGTDSRTAQFVFLPTFAYWNVTQHVQKEELELLDDLSYTSLSLDPLGPPPKG